MLSSKNSAIFASKLLLATEATNQIIFNDMSNNSNQENIIGGVPVQSIIWDSDRCKLFEPKIIEYVSKLDTSLPTQLHKLVIEARELRDLYHDPSFLENPNDFDKLTDIQKCFISLAYISSRFTEFLLNIEDYKDYKDTLDEIYSQIKLSKAKEQSSGMDADGKERDNDNNNLRKTHARQSFFISFDSQRIELTSLDFEKPESFIGLFENESDLEPRRIFEDLISYKKTACFLIGMFYRIMAPFDSCNFKLTTYSTLCDAINNEDYNQFITIVNNLRTYILFGLSGAVDSNHRSCGYIETQTSNNVFDATLENLSNKDYPSPIFRSSFNSMILIITINDLLFRILFAYLKPSEVAYFNLFWKSRFGTNAFFYYSKVTNFVEWFHSWIIQETNWLSFRSLLSSDNNCDDDIEYSPGHSYFTHESKRVESSIENKPKLIIKTVLNLPEHIEVHCSKEMLTKLAEGLVRGIDDETKPLVTSKVKERNGTIIKKLVCLFSGVGKNDESLEWPYNLEWTDYANSLKLLVYLLHYEGKLDDPLKAINEKDKDGIAEVIKQDFKGIPVWNIVGPALGYKKRSLGSTAKIPVKNNVGLMKKLAQFWFECKKLDD